MTGPGDAGDGVENLASGARGDARPAPEVPVVLGSLTPADVGECARLEALLFPGDDPWSAAAFRSELQAGHPYVAARAGDRLVGYAGIALLPAPASGREPAEAEVHTIGVDPMVQGHGVGRRLLRALLDRADAIGAVTYLEVRTDNVPALALYRSEGFEVVGTRRRYYASGADAHTMRRPAVAPAATRGYDPR